MHLGVVASESAVEQRAEPDEARDLVGSPVGWHPVERALPVSAGVENITAKSTPKKDVLVTAKQQRPSHLLWIDNAMRFLLRHIQILF